MIDGDNAPLEGRLDGKTPHTGPWIIFFYCWPD